MYGTSETQTSDRNIFPLSSPAIQNEDQPKKATFKAFVIKSLDPGAHGPLGFSAPGEEEKIDW
jgi:hypothetical protein